MPITLAQIAANRATTTLSYAGESVTLVYCPDRVTERTFAAISGLQDASADNLAERAAALNATLCDLLVSWDVLQDDGASMYPITPESLPALPLAFRAAVLNAIFDGLTMGEPTGTTSKKRSGGTSSRKGA